MTAIDWIIVGLYLLATLGIGAWFSRRAGRSLSWWIAGTSIVATTFASDTPLDQCTCSRRRQHGHGVLRPNR